MCTRYEYSLEKEEWIPQKPALTLTSPSDVKYKFEFTNKRYAKGCMIIGTSERAITLAEIPADTKEQIATELRQWQRRNQQWQRLDDETMDEECEYKTVWDDDE